MEAFRHWNRLFRPSHPQERLEWEKDIEDELRFHLEMRKRDNERAGMPPDSATVDAEERFGDVDAIRSECLFIKEQNLGRDITRWLQTAAGLTVSLTALCLIFLILNGVLVRLPLTYHTGQDWVAMWWEYGDEQLDSDSSVKDYEAFLKQQGVFDTITAAVYRTHYLGSSPGPPRKVRGKHVTPAYFEVHGASLVHGRDFTVADQVHQTRNVVILSHALWQERFGGDADIIGRSMHIDETDAVIIGVAPASFQMYYPTDFFVPLRFSQLHNPERPQLLVSGLLADGTSRGEAQSALNELVPYAPHRSLVLRDVKDVYADNIKRPIVSYLTLAVLIVLLLGIHHARKQLYQPYEQKRAHTWHDMRQRWPHAWIWIATAAACLGISCALWLVQWVEPYLLKDFDHLFSIEADANVWMFYTGVLFVVLFLFGMAPRLATPHRLRRSYAFLSTTEIALAFMIFPVACLLARDILVDQYRGPGYTPDNVLSLDVSLPPHLFASPDERRDLMVEVFDSVEALPGVTLASLSSTLPETYSPFVMSFYQTSTIKSDAAIAPRQTVRSKLVGIDYLQMLDIPLKGGRYFSLDDFGTDEQPVIINEEMARTFWPHCDPIGHTMYLGTHRMAARIVGVVANVATIDAPEMTPPTLYQLYWVSGASNFHLLLKTDRSPSATVAAVQETIWSIHPEVPVQQASWLPAVRNERTSSQLFLFAMYALLAVGTLLIMINATISGINQHIEWQLHSIGASLQSEQSNLRTQLSVCRNVIVMLLPGIVVGIAGSLLLMHGHESLHLYNKPMDVPGYVLVAFLMTAILVGSAYCASRKVRTIDPELALRYS